LNPDSSPTAPRRIVALLLAGGADPALRNRAGATPVHLAAANSHVAVVRTHPPHTPHTNPHTPVHLAANSHVAVVRTHPPPTPRL
jgi:hypothetical protein